MLRNLEKGISIELNINLEKQYKREMALIVVNKSISIRKVNKLLQKKNYSRKMRGLLRKMKI